MKSFLESKFEVSFSMGVEEFSERLKSNVDTEGLLNILSRSKSRKFLGLVNGPGFKIHKKIKYRNSSLPQMHGKVEPCGDGTKVLVTMRPNPSTYTFLAAWNIGTLCALAFSWSLCGFTTIYNLVYLGLLILGNGIAYWGFWSEVDSSKRLFLNLFG